MQQSIKIIKNRIVEILLENKPSIYLYGSVVLEDFKLGWSDIDILCLTETEISDTQGKKLLNLRQELSREYRNNLYFPSFEGGFLTLEGFVNNNPDTVVYWGTSGQKITNKYCVDPFSMIELIEQGRLLYGKEVRQNFLYPRKEEILEAVIKHYDTIRKFGDKTDKSLYSAGWLLDIARCIYTLRTGKIISKTKAGKWALDNNLIEDIEVMEKAIRIRKEPNKYKDHEEVIKWLEGLGPYIQRFADLLEKEISMVK